MPLPDAEMRVLKGALRDPAVVARYRAKVLEVPGSDCLWWSAAVSGRGHGRFYVGTLPTGHRSNVDSDCEGEVRDLCVIAHRFGYALVYGATVLNSVPVGPFIGRPGKPGELHKHVTDEGRMTSGLPASVDEQY